MSLEELQRWVGVPGVVVRVQQRNGRVWLVAGELEKASRESSGNGSEQLRLEFRRLSPDLLKDAMRRDGSELPLVGSRSVWVAEDSQFTRVVSIGLAAPQLAPDRPKRLRLRGRAAEVREALADGTYRIPFDLESPEKYAVASRGRGLRTQHDFDPTFIDALKQEQNAVGSVVIEELLAQATQKPPEPFRLVPPKPVFDLEDDFEPEPDRRDVHERLAHHVAFGFSRFLPNKFVSAEARQGLLGSGLDALDVMVQFHRKHQGTGREFYDGAQSIFAGLSTIERASGDLARVIPRVFTEQAKAPAPDPKQMVTVFRNSRALLERLATSDIGLQVLDDLRGRGTYDGPQGWDPAHFELVGEGDAQMLALTPAFIERHKAERGPWVGSPPANATGCPALVAGIFPVFFSRMASELEAVYLDQGRPPPDDLTASSV